MLIKKAVYLEFKNSDSIYINLYTDSIRLFFDYKKVSNLIFNDLLYNGKKRLKMIRVDKKSKNLLNYIGGVEDYINIKYRIWSREFPSKNYTYIYYVV